MSVLLGAGALIACESLKLGDAGLSKAPETSGATVDTLFATLKDADKVLAEAYYYLPYGIACDYDNRMGNDQLEALTDQYISNKVTDSDGPNLLYYNGALSASTSMRKYMAYNFGGTSDDRDYYAIRYGWLFLENADRIPNAPAAAVAQKKAEAKMCIAVAYSNMLRYVGGVPLLDHAVRADEAMEYPRATFAETVDYIVKLCDEAAPDLPWYTSATDDGRMTKAAALGLKLRVLCYAASPTFNSNTLWRSDADEYVCYTNYDANRWKRAKDAADEFMAQLIGNGYYQMIQAEPDGTGVINPRAYRLAYRKGYFNRGTTECIISIRKSNKKDYHDSMIKDAGNYGNGCPLDYVNKFGWADGTEFPADFDWENPDREPFFKMDPAGTLIVGGQSFIETRDPRLYENVAVPGDIWRDGTVGRAYDNHRYRQQNCPGFLQMKYILQQSTDRNLPPHWCMMRLPEVLLNAAEAYNEYDGAPSEKAYGWVNAVRARVGLCPLPEGLSKEEFRKALIRERDCEFGFEEVRWFDMVRWGLTEAFTTPLSALSSIGNKDSEATTFKFKVRASFPSRSWWTNWDTKWYLSPIPTVEINKGYGMTQNPGW